MVAPRKTRRVVCTVIRVPANDLIDTLTDLRPSNRLPWTDPTIARLVTKLQDEVRYERREAKLACRTAHAPVADLDPPSPSSDNDWEWREEPRWSWPIN
jgi:hypothetical protein